MAITHHAQHKCSKYFSVLCLLHIDTQWRRCFDKDEGWVCAWLEHFLSVAYSVERNTTSQYNSQIAGGQTMRGTSAQVQKPQKSKSLKAFQRNPLDYSRCPISAHSWFGFIREAFSLIDIVHLSVLYLFTSARKCCNKPGSKYWTRTISVAASQNKC